MVIRAMHIALLTRTGSHAFNRRMIAALRAEGHRVDITEIGGPDDAERAVDGLTETCCPLVDARALADFTACSERLLAHDPATLVHHPQHAARDLLPRLRRVITTSPPLADRLTHEFEVDAARLRLVMPGVDEAPRSTGSGGPGCAILAIGALIPRKGHALLLQALARLFDLDWSLTIVGTPHRDPEHAQQLATLARTHGIGDRVHFAGAVDDETLATHWNRADLFALACRWEGYPLAVADALKRGVPVAITGDDLLAAAVPLHAGVVCPPDDRDQLSRALRRLIFDPGLRRSYADAAFAAGGLLPAWSAQAALLVEALR